MPKDAQDVVAARELVTLDPQELAPVIPEMLRHLKHHDSPVAETFCEFFARNGDRHAASVAAVLGRSTMPEIRRVLLSRVLPSWSREAVSQCAAALSLAATDPHSLDSDLLAMRLLARHDLADRAWLGQWMAFKIARMQERSALLEAVAAEIEGRAHEIGPG